MREKKERRTCISLLIYLKSNGTEAEIYVLRRILAVVHSKAYTTFRIRSN